MSEFGELLDRARAGDAAAQEALLERHLGGLRAYVRLQTGAALRAKESCSDLVQSICRELLQDLAGFRSATEPAFRKWLYSLALRKILDKSDFYAAQKRDAGREVDPAPTDERLLDAYATLCTPSQHAAAREEVARIEQAFDLLPEDYREVITSHCIVGATHREIAARLGRSEEAVRMLLHRARARLAMLLD